MTEKRSDSNLRRGRTPEKVEKSMGLGTYFAQRQSRVAVSEKIAMLLVYRAEKIKAKNRNEGSD